MIGFVRPVEGGGDVQEGSTKNQRYHGVNHGVKETVLTDFGVHLWVMGEWGLSG